jgi:hypothetical protein
MMSMDWIYFGLDTSMDYPDKWITGLQLATRQLYDVLGKL